MKLGETTRKQQNPGRDRERVPWVASSPDTNVGCWMLNVECWMIVGTGPGSMRRDAAALTSLPSPESRHLTVANPN